MASGVFRMSVDMIWASQPRPCVSNFTDTFQRFKAWGGGNCLFLQEGDTRRERRWTRPFKGASGLGEGELAEWCLFQRMPEPLQPGGRTRVWAPGWEGPGQAAGGSCFFLR